MSVLIKNATMPSTCGNCKLALGCTYCLACMLTGHIVDDFGKSPACPIVEVVHCKDCKHSYDSVGGRCCSHGVCVDCIVREDFFCADGERRADDV